MIRLHVLSNATGIAHYLLLAQSTGVAFCILVMARNILSLKLPHYFTKIIVALSIIITWVIVYMTYKNIGDIFGGICLTFASTALLYRDTPLLFRSNHIIAGFCWFIFSITSLSIPGAINSLLNISSNIIGAIRKEEFFEPLRLRLNAVRLSFK